MRVCSYILGLFAAAITLFFAGCGPTTGADSKPVVVCTIFSYYDAARAIAGDKARVEIILPTGKSPHEYTATPDNKTAVYVAKLYIKNGMDLDDRFDGLLDGSKAKVLDISKVIDTKIVLKTAEVSLDDAEKKDSARYVNPHIWLDPHVQMAAAEKIRDAIVEMDPADAPTFRANAEIYLASLKKLDADFADAASHFKTKEFIGFHSAYDYLAHRYGLKQIASIEEIPGIGLTIAQTTKIVDLINSKKIKYIAIENAFSSSGINSIKTRTGVETITLQPLETYDDVNDTYEKLMRQNLEALKMALQ